jgi:hypothetical protein
MRKSLDFENKIYSIRNGDEIKIEYIKKRNDLDFEVRTNLGMSSLFQVYKWGSNTHVNDINKILEGLRSYWEKKICELQYYSNHKMRLGFNYFKLSAYSCSLQLTINDNLIKDYCFNMTDDNVHDYKKRVMSFLDGFENGLKINGRQKHGN